MIALKISDVIMCFRHRFGLVNSIDTYIKLKILVEYVEKKFGLKCVFIKFTMPNLILICYCKSDSFKTRD